MAASPTGTKVQANFKIGNDLFNVYAESMSEFVDLLAELEETGITAIHNVQSKLAGAHTVATATAAATPVPRNDAPPASFANATVPTGPDGTPRVAKSGVGSKGPWKAWMTVARKGQPGYADPIWIDRGTPEWNSFPA